MTTATAVKDFAPDDVQARRQGLGGSDAAAAIGCNPYKSPYELWLEKTGRFTPKPAGEAAYWGNVLEDTVAKEFSKRTGLKVRRDNKTHCHPEHPFMFAHLDRRIVGNNWGLEVKTASPFLKGFDEEGTDQIPMQYLAQVHHYIQVCDLDGMEIALLKGGQALKFFTVTRDNDFGDMLCRFERFFWEQHVLADVAPAPTCDRDLAQMPVTGEEVEVTPQVLEALETTKELKAKIKEFESLLQTEENKVKFFMGGKSKLVLGDRILATLKKHTRKTLDAEELKNRFPLIYQNFQKETPYRALRLKD